MTNKIAEQAIRKIAIVRIETIWISYSRDEPARILSEVRRVLKAGSPIVLNEVMNSSFLVLPCWRLQSVAWFVEGWMTASADVAVAHHGEQVSNCRLLILEREFKIDLFLGPDFPVDFDVRIDKVIQWPAGRLWYQLDIATS